MTDSRKRSKINLNQSFNLISRRNSELFHRSKRRRIYKGMGHQKLGSHYCHGDYKNISDLTTLDSYICSFQRIINTDTPRIRLVMCASNKDR